MQYLRVFFLLYILFTCRLLVPAQSMVGSGNTGKSERPKLVIGLVVDQMRWDYLYRYADKYNTGGFKRLLNEGYSCANTQINYTPSYTACGHSCIYTGSVPAIHGIAGNEWYVREQKQWTYCTTDTAYKLVGKGGLKGNTSPNNLLTTTITDELRLATNFQSKVIALALKDRSSVLPGGHTANAAYFMDYTAANFVTSTYYMKELPAWVNAFNDKKLVQKYVADNWNTIRPLQEYHESTADDVPHERAFKGEEKPVFVHKTAEIMKVNPEVIVNSPFGNSITFDFAKAAIEGENLGKGKSTDFLAISLSSPDYIGHQFGPNSIEIEDCYLRLDKDLEAFLLYLDEKIGKGEYLLFLTADHGAAHSTGYMKQNRIPAGSFPVPDTTRALLNKALEKKFGAGEWIEAYENMQLYLDKSLMQKNKVSRGELLEFISEYMLQFESVANVVDLRNLAGTSLPANMKEMMVNGYNVKRSGDFQVIYNPGWLEGYTKGTSHGTAYPYDTHIPLIWFGWKVLHAEDNTPVYMTDIAPTIAALLHIQEPNGNIGRVIHVAGR